LPAAGTISGASTVCSGSTITLTDAGSVGTGSWSSSNTGIASVNTSGIVTGIASGSVTITYTATNSCGSASTYSVITVNSLPSAGTITGTYTVCPASTTTLSDAAGTGAWSSSNTSIATVSTGGVVRGIASGTANISYSVTNGCSTVATYSVVTVNALASAGAVTGTYSVCAGSTTTLTDVINGGTWSSSNTGVATVSTSGAVKGLSAGTANISYAVTNVCGTVTTYAVMTVNALPSAGSISGTTSLCTTTTTTLTDAAGAGSWSSSNMGIATVSTSGVVYGIAAGTTNISYSVTTGCGTAAIYTVVTVAAEGTWLGTANNDWYNTANWPCGIIPGAGLNINIPAGTAYAPAIDTGAASVASITIARGVTLTINSGASLNVKNTLTNNGTTTGNLNLNGTTSQTLAGNGTFYNLQLNNTSGATISTGDTIKISGTLTLTSGTLTTNGGLVIASDSVGTGRIGTITGGAISGNVTVQQYITGGRRAYRFLGHPFSTYVPLSQLEQYVDITGAGGSSNGFTTTVSNSPSCYWYAPQYGNSALGFVLLILTGLNHMKAYAFL